MTSLRATEAQETAYPTDSPQELTPLHATLSDGVRTVELSVRDFTLERDTIAGPVDEQGNRGYLPGATVRTLEADMPEDRSTIMAWLHERSALTLRLNYTEVHNLRIQQFDVEHIDGTPSRLSLQLV